MKQPSESAARASAIASFPETGSRVTVQARAWRPAPTAAAARMSASLPPLPRASPPRPRRGGEPVEDAALGGGRAEQPRHPGEHEEVGRLEERRGEDRRADEERPRLAERAGARGEPLDPAAGAPRRDDEDRQRRGEWE